MFYRGDLRSGIARALQEQKSVACFVADDGDESTTCQESYLAEQEIRAALDSKAILIRIESGSTEAQFLTAYYPVAATPSLVIIQYVKGACAHVAA